MSQQASTTSVAIRPALNPVSTGTTSSSASKCSGAKNESLKELQAPYFAYTNHSELPDADPMKPVTVPGRIPNFPAKLFAILSRPELSDIISWMPHGRSWRVHKPREFEIKVIPSYFDHAKYSSFIRQANGWGFKRVSTKGPDRNSHYHELFLRGLPHLLKLMKRPNSSGSNKTPDPDFYKISEEYPLPEPSKPAPEESMSQTLYPSHAGIVIPTTQPAAPGSSVYQHQLPLYVPLQSHRVQDAKLPPNSLANADSTLLDGPSSVPTALAPYPSSVHLRTNYVAPLPQPVVAPAPVPQPPLPPSRTTGIAAQEDQCLDPLSLFMEDLYPQEKAVLQTYDGLYPQRLGNTHAPANVVTPCTSSPSTSPQPILAEPNPILSTAPMQAQHPLPIPQAALYRKPAEAPLSPILTQPLEVSYATTTLEPYALPDFQPVENDLNGFNLDEPFEGELELGECW